MFGICITNYNNSEIDDLVRKHMDKKMTTMRVSKDNHAEILKIVGILQSKTGNPTTVDEAIDILLSNYYKKNPKSTN